MLIARSAAECRLYMGLHPCRCGETRFDAEHALRLGPDGAMLADYHGACSACGGIREFVFELDAALPPPPPAFGGNEPSKIICPGQFIQHAARLAGSVPLDPTDLPAGERNRAAAILDEAFAAFTEVLKFIPPTEVAVPEQAFLSDEGYAVYQSEHGRFRRDRLEANIDALRTTLGFYRR